MKCIVGLGNPGLQYSLTRHNVGFLAVESLRLSLGFPEWQKITAHKALISSWLIEGEKCLLAQPQTYMNLSGESVASILGFYKMETADLIVISDDIDMEFGKIRYRSNGSSGGQNGLKSIAEKLGTSEFSRIKIGIGRDDRYEMSDWVLSKFGSDELETLKEVYVCVQNRVIEWIQESY
jgi:peptidyl-tRNA hydrolase, PTH1 family